MSFLKKLGQVLATGTALITGFMPLVQPLLGRNNKLENVAAKITDTLTLIGTAVVTVETAFTGIANSGAQKLAAAINLIGPMIRTSELVAGKEIADEVLFQKGVNGIAQGVVDILNALKSSGVKTT